MNQADSIHLSSTESYLTKIYYMISEGNLTQAQHYLQNLKSPDQKDQKNSILLTWLQALIDFGLGKYKESLKNLKKVFETQPRCPPSIRFAIGLCYYRLDNIVKARIAFEKVLELDPGHSMANAALAVIDLQS